MCMGDGRTLEDSQGLTHSRKVKKEEYANVTSKQGRQRRTRSTLCPRSQGQCLSLTSVASLHVWAQPHCVRTGTCVLGGVAGDLRSRKAQVFTPAVGLGAQFTGICSWWQGRGRQTKCWDTDRPCQVLLSSNNEIPPLDLLKNLSFYMGTHQHSTWYFIPTLIQFLQFWQMSPCSGNKCTNYNSRNLGGRL